MFCKLFTVTIELIQSFCYIS